jgi:hypothetical protein
LARTRRFDDNLIIRAHRRTANKEVVVAANSKFTRIPKIRDLLLAGVPTEVIPTYCALADHANNKTGLCWPKMETLAKILNRSVRTVQRHLHLLQNQGLIEFMNRRRYKGRFGSYLYKVLHISRTTGHRRPKVGPHPIYKRTKPSKNNPQSPQKEGYEWLFGQERNSESEAEYQRHQREQRKQASEKRKEGYEWLFG